MRFNPSKYNPADDSSKGAPVNGNVVLVIPDGTCASGSGAKPKSLKSQFAQGGDARLKGVLIRAAITGTKVEIRRGRNKPVVVSAEALAKSHGFYEQVATAKDRFAASQAKAPSPRKRPASKGRSAAPARRAKATRDRSAAAKKAAATRKRNAAARK